MISAFFYQEQLSGIVVTLFSVYNTIFQAFSDSELVFTGVFNV
jgi:hypothetical protein